LGLQVALRIILAIIFGALGNLVAHSNVPPNAPFSLPWYTIIVATVIFAAIGAFLPDIVSALAKIGIARLAEAITSKVVDQVGKTRNSFHRKNNGKVKGEINGVVNPLVLDTSAIIDGRFTEVCQTGFVFGTILVIPSVLGELQHIADSSDDLKRKKGRRGLEILSHLKKNKYVKVKVLKNDPSGRDVDNRLVNLAKSVKGKVVTTDYNLNKVASVSNVKVLNVNELANVVKTPLVPGEEIQVEVIQPGKEKNQGVGYLSDGTMIVVEEGEEYLGKSVKVKVSRIIQTVAGRMIFVKVK
jgi:uncharacterized protein YacL